MPKKKYKRITADFDDRSYKMLSDAAEKIHSTKADAIRRSLGLFSFILDQQSSGHKIVVEDEDGGNRKEILPFF